MDWNEVVERMFRGLVQGPAMPDAVVVPEIEEEEEDE